MYNKTKGVMGNNSDIKIRVRWDLYEKCRFEDVNDDEGDENRCGSVRKKRVVQASERRSETLWRNKNNDHSQQRNTRWRSQRGDSP